MIKVALPISVQGLITSSLTLVDNLMVGSLGESELSAVGVAGNVFFVFFLLIWGFCAGCSTFLAQFFGAGDMKNIRKTLGFMVLVCGIIAGLFFLVTFGFPRTVLRLFTDIPVMIDLGAKYMRIAAFSTLFLVLAIPSNTALRSIQKPHIPLVTGIISFATNTILNYVLIFGGKVPVSGKPRDFVGWPREFITRILRNAFPVTLNESLWGLGVTLYAAAFARISVTAYASIQASLAINDLFQTAAMGVGDASLILLGQKLGENNMEEARIYAKKFIRAGLFVGIVVGLLLILLGRPIVGFFDFTEEGAMYTRHILTIFGVMMPVTLLNMIIVTGVLRSGGDTRFAMIADAGSVWVLGIPAAFLSALVFHWPIDMCAAAIQLEALVKLVVIWVRYRQEKWVKNVIAGL